MEDTTPENDEWTLTDVLIGLRWPGGWTCACCGSKHYRRVRTRPRVLQCASCRRQISVTAGTVLHRTRLPLRTWFRAIEMFVRIVGISTRSLAALVGVHVETAWQMLHRIRVAFDGQEPLLKGLVKRTVIVIGCREPRVDPVIECVVLAGREGQVRIMQGSPCVDPSLGGSVQGAARKSRFECKLERRGGDPDAIGTMRHRLELSSFVDADAQVEPMQTGDREVRFVYALQRRLRAYHEVSERWLARYLGAFAFLWRQWAERGGEFCASLDVEGQVHGVFARCLARPRATFAEITPMLC